MTADELLLVEQAKAGNKKAINELFYREQKYIYNLLVQLTGERALADDLAQETFLLSYRYLNKFKLQSSFRTWISKIAVNLFRKELKRKPKHVSICLDTIRIPIQNETPERIAIKRELQWCILHSLQQHVPKRYRTVLVLRDLNDLSYKEISAILSWNIGKIKNCLHRGRKILRDHFINGKCRAFAEKDYLCVCKGILQ